MNSAIALGVDLVEVSRFRQLSPAIRERFFKRVFTLKEREEIASSYERAAGVFAAKESLAKALGCGIGPVSWQEIEVIKDDAGKPSLCLSGQAKALSQKAGIAEWSVSISHARENAVAVVLGIGKNTG